MFEHRGSFNRKESSYYDAFTEMIEILNIKFLKCIKLKTINLKFVNTNSIKSTVCPQSSFGVLKNCGAQTNLASHMRFAADYSETLDVLSAANRWDKRPSFRFSVSCL
jgi:hypothetical protein